jgi:7-cyano-7-deazaguanine synthase
LDSGLGSAEINAELRRYDTSITCIGIIPDAETQDAARFKGVLEKTERLSRTAQEIGCEVIQVNAFTELADHYGAERRLVADISYLAAIGGSSLVEADRPVETGLPAPAGGVPSTYVPFRNAHILCGGVSWAEVLGAEALFIGAVQEDGSGYPDCREEFYRRFAAAVDEGTRPETEIAIRTPLIHLDKAAIVRRGRELSVPLHLTWSCYTEAEMACGVCESCRLRLRGFAAAGIADPIPYRPR